MKSVNLVVFVLISSFYFNISSMEIIEFVIGTKKHETVRKMTDNKEIFAKANMYLLKEPLCTMASLKAQEKLQTNAKSSVNNWGDRRINPGTLMAKVFLLKRKSNGLDGEQEKHLWDTFPGWVSVEFLKKSQIYRYQLHVKKIVDEKSIPVVVTLVANPRIGIEPYQFLNQLENEYEHPTKMELAE